MEQVKEQLKEAIEVVNLVMDQLLESKHPKKIAEAAQAYYSEFRKAEFTDEQAFELTKQCVNSLSKTNKS